MRHCDICKLMFPSCAPDRPGATVQNSWNVAAYEGKLLAGPWADLCGSHASHAVRGTLQSLTEKV